MKDKILIVDDEKEIADLVAFYLESESFEAVACYEAQTALEHIEKTQFDLAILDIMLPGTSGFELCRELRQKTDVPILFISARTSDDDQIIALNIGGDDYIQKPYSLSVLLAKVKVVLKRYGEAACSVYSDDWLTVDLDTRQVTAGGRPARLTALEFRLLSYLIRHENKVISKQELFENVWEDKFTGDGTLNVHIRKIREAIERTPGKPEYILTVWGDGYRFCGGRK